MQELQFCQRESLKVGHILMKDMGLVKTRRLATMHKQTTYAKAVVDKQRAKAGMKARKSSNSRITACLEQGDGV